MANLPYTPVAIVATAFITHVVIEHMYVNYV